MKSSLTPRASAPAADDEARFPEDAVEVGRILDAWGIKGAFKVQAFSADPQALFSSRRWFLKPALPRPGMPAPRPLPAGAVFPPLLRVTQAREQGEWVVAQAQEVSDRTSAEALRGARVYVSRSSFPTASEDEYYWVDLIGLEVWNREGHLLGTVTDLIDTGPHCVLRIQRPDAAETVGGDDGERLIPFVSAFVDQVDLPSRRITVDWGLDY